MHSRSERSSLAVCSPRPDTSTGAPPDLAARRSLLGSAALPAGSERRRAGGGAAGEAGPERLCDYSGGRRSAGARDARPKPKLDRTRSKPQRCRCAGHRPGARRRLDRARSSSGRHARLPVRDGGLAAAARLAGAGAARHRGEVPDRAGSGAGGGVALPVCLWRGARLLRGGAEHGPCLEPSRTLPRALHVRHASSRGRRRRSTAGSRSTTCCSGETPPTLPAGSGGLARHRRERRTRRQRRRWRRRRRRRWRRLRRRRRRRRRQRW